MSEPYVVPASSVPEWLAIDVGNSRIKFGLFTQPTLATLPECLTCLTVPLSSPVPWSELVSTLKRFAIRSVIVGSNQAGVDRLLTEWPSELGPAPVAFRDSSRFPIKIDVEQPERVGLDRLLTAIAANVIRPAEREVVIVDCGTATTVDRVDSRGAFSGGAILPGFELSARALHHYTEVLPLIPIEAIVEVDSDSGGHEALGRNTLDAMMSGIFWGQIGAVRELIQRVSGCSSSDLMLMLAGGGSRLLVPHFPNAIYSPDLALQGIVVMAADC